MAVIVDVPGVGPVEARNAATESTLRELVNAIKGMSGSGGGAAGAAGAGAAGGMLTSLSKASKSAQGFASSTTSGAKSMAGSAANATKAIGKGLVGAVGLGAKGIIGVAGAAKMGAEALASLTAKAAEMISTFAGVGNDLGKAAQTLAPIPIVGGALAATLGAVGNAAAGVVNAFTEASASGVTFGGSVNAMARSASQAGMTIDQFASLIAKNGEGLLAFGTTTEGGAKRFAALSKDLRNAGSDLYALGYSTEQINNGLAKYGALMRAQGLQGTQSNQQLVAGAKNYLKEIDALAKITGEERSAKEAQMKALATDAQFQMAMAGKSAEARASFMKLVGGFGPTLGGFVKDFVATGTLTTEENQRIATALGSETMGELTKLRQKLLANQELSDVEQDRLRAIMKKASEAGSKQIGSTLAATRENDAMSKAYIEGMQLNVGAVKQTADEQGKAAEGTDKMNEQVRKSQEALASFSNSFQMALANSGLLDLLMDAFGFMANIVQKFVIPAFNMLSPILAKMFYGIEALAIPVIEALSGSMGGLQDVADFITDILDDAFGILDAVVRAVIDIFRSVYGAVQRIIEPFKRISQRVSSTGDALDGFTEIIAEVGTIIGGTFEFLGEIIGGTIELFMDLWDWLMSFEAVGKLAGKVADGFDTLKTYLSADGAKLLLAQVRDFFVNAIGGFFLDLKDGWELFMIDLGRLLGKVSFGAFGLKKEEAEEQRKAIEERKKEREEEAALAKREIEQHRSNMMTSRAAKEVAETERKSANKNARAEFSERMRGIKGLGAANDKEAGVRKEALKGKEEAVKNYNDPIQLLLGEAKQQGKANEFLASATAEAQGKATKTSGALGQIKTPESKAAAAAQGAKAGMEAKAEEKAAEAKKAEEAAKEAAKPTPTETPATTPGPGQTSGQTAIAQLNSNIEELVRLMRINNNLTSEQSSGLSRLAGSVTGDLFQV